MQLMNIEPKVASLNKHSKDLQHLIRMTSKVSDKYARKS